MIPSPQRAQETSTGIKMSAPDTAQTECMWLVEICTFWCSPEDQNVALRQQRAQPTHQDVYQPRRTDISAQASSQPFLMAYTPPPQYKSAHLRPKAQPNSRWIQLRLRGQGRAVVTATTATTVTVSPSRWIPTNRLLSAACLRPRCCSVDPGVQRRPAARALPANDA